MTSARFEEIFEAITQLRVGVIGDFAVDFYIDLQTTTGEFSIETQQEVHWGKHPKTSLGGAGNVVQNVRALGVRDIHVFGYIGNDIFGREMRYLLQSLPANTDGLLALPHTDTCTYTKPLTEGVEQHRLDFGTNNILKGDDFEAIMDILSTKASMLDVVLVNQQFPNPLLTADRIKRLNTLIRALPNVHFVADLRALGDQIRAATLKVNTAELARILALPTSENSDEWCTIQARKLQQIIQAPVLVTRGEKGILYAASEHIVQIKGYELDGPLDTVGAGDTVLAAFAMAQAVEASPQEALQIANAAAAVTVQKLHQTGTATPQEIRNILL